ncbi:oxygen-independent coproporphyrinogen III oxidase [Abyssogena phaseoliformis symbiont OG214]|nr:oxygen-independent coproporphyrinogen III oxidase [Abyssogena phaseoliformis symbiont OG214]
MPPLALYIHYPWCVKKCPYCDFNSHEGNQQSGYITALLKDLDEDLDYVQGRSIQSIFLGGGTPSLMNEQALFELFSGLKTRLKFADDIEITLETNPGTFEIEKFKAFKRIGINRLSIGVQSFNDQHLKSLGRIHNADEAIYACEKAKQVGFEHFNIDIMYGLENQTLDDYLSDINQAVNLNPEHISFYQLTIEPNTYFAKFPPTLPNDNDIFKMGNRGVNLLEKNGYIRYEVSAFGKTPSRHNLNYWQFGDYIGIGAGAHGKITCSNEPYSFRTTKARSPKDYLKNRQNQVKSIENLSFDFMLNALRLKHGFDLALFTLRTGQSIQAIECQLNKAQALGLLELNDRRIQPSEKGFDFLNDLQAIFL